MRNTQTYPTLDEIKAKKKEFLAKTKVQKEKKPSRSTQLRAFLGAIKSEIKQSVQNGASNGKIVKAIEETYGVKVSAPSFAKFCADSGINTNKRARKTQA